MRVRAEEVAALLRAMPDWVSVPQDAWPSRRAALNASAAEVADRLVAYPTDALREGVAFLASRGLSVEDAGRLLLTHRLAFEVPEWVEAPFGFFGGFSGPRSEAGLIQIGWPIVRSSGRPEIAYAFAGYYGDEFQALREFDRFAQVFARAV